MVQLKVQLVYFHVDEKWFMSLVARMYNKIAPEYGCSPVYHRIHHKHSVKKLLTICAIAIDPWKNDLRRGDTAEKVCITRCGGEMKATEDSYSRVYVEDGSYTYPRLPENQLRKKGEEYFENWEITGSTHESKGDKKYPLTEWVAK